MPEKNFIELPLETMGEVIDELQKYPIILEKRIKEMSDSNTKNLIQYLENALKFVHLKMDEAEYSISDIESKIILYKNQEKEIRSHIERLKNQLNEQENERK